jgi:hypothetical protein
MTPSDPNKLNKKKLREEMASLENKYFPDESKLGLFRLETFYFDFYDHVALSEDDDVQIRCDTDPNQKKNHCLDLVSIKARFYGGVLTPQIESSTTKCILNKRYYSSLLIAYYLK